MTTTAALIRMLAMAVLVMAASACETANVCPLTAEAAETGEFMGLGDETVVFTGHVIRYIDAPDLELRGYELNVVRWLRGTASPEGTFLRVPRQVAGIGRAQPVLIIGEPGENERVIVAGPCSPLVPISEDAVEAR